MNKLFSRQVLGPTLLIATGISSIGCVECPITTPGCHVQRYVGYLDADGDGFGDPNVRETFLAIPPAGYVAFGTDCDDSDPDIYPGNVEIIDGKDNNCDGEIDVLNRHFFVSSQTHNGDFTENGLYDDPIEGANAFCQQLADNSDIETGVYKAFIASNAMPAMDNLTISEVPYVLYNGDVVAVDFQDLVTNDLSTTNLLTELGTPLSNPIALAWTGMVTIAGVAGSNNPNSPGPNCEEWSTASAQVEGSAGTVGGTGETWYGGTVSSCSAYHHVYCLQQ